MGADACVQDGLVDAEDVYGEPDTEAYDLSLFPLILGDDIRTIVLGDVDPELETI